MFQFLIPLIFQLFREETQMRAELVNFLGIVASVRQLWAFLYWLVRWQTFHSLVYRGNSCIEPFLSFPFATQFVFDLQYLKGVPDQTWCALIQAIIYYQIYSLSHFMAPRLTFFLFLGMLLLNWSENLWNLWVSWLHHSKIRS